jgi:hypothetical protein
MTTKHRPRAVLALTVALVVLLATQAGAGAATGTTAAIGKSQREAVVLVTTLSANNPSALEQGFYDLVESGAILTAAATLGPRYNTVTIVKDAAATRSGLVSALRTAASHSGTKAVDLFISTHGLDNQLVFAEGTRSITSVRNAILVGLTSAQRAKLRIVYSTACIGQSHLTGWIQAGFAAAAGSKGIYTDSAFSHPAFLASWALFGRTFGQSVSAANGADVFHVSDGAAALYFTSQGAADKAKLVNSTRVTAGNTGLKIDSAP